VRAVMDEVFGEDNLDDRFHESCHNEGIHLDSWTPI
jgi:hypothetical protein